MRHLALALLAIALPTLALADEHKLSQVTLERTGCFGTCPAYKVTIKSDGTVIYHGEAFVEHIGDYKAKLYFGCLEFLSASLDKLGFWRLKTSYSAGSMTDLPTEYITAVSDLGTQKIREYGQGGPIELWMSLTLVDGLLSDAREWKKVGPKKS